jgi:hypothetical protein
MTFNDTVAQFAHMGWGALLTDSLGARLPVKYVMIGVAAFALGKELIEQVWGAWEPPQLTASTLEDLLFWGIGIGLGFLALRWAQRKI